MRRACKKVRKNLVAFLNHQLEEKKAKEVEQHLDACSLCKKEEEELRLTWNLLGRLPVNKDFPDILNGVLERIDRESAKVSLFQHFVEFTVTATEVYIGIIKFYICPGSIGSDYNLI